MMTSSVDHRPFPTSRPRSLAAMRAVAMSMVPEYKRFRAPRRHGESLVDPPWGEVERCVEENGLCLSRFQGDLQGRPWSQLRQEARQELLVAARSYTAGYRDVPEVAGLAGRPLLLAGHQPELFHAGVWFKNFALSSLGQRLGAVAVNLLIDNDILQTPAVRVPSCTARGVQVGAVAFDAASEAVPYEERTIRDAACFASFGERVAAALDGTAEPPLVHRYWPLAIAAARRTNNLGRCLAEARHVLEGQWGQCTLELPLSVTCTSTTFAWFTAHLLAHLPRFWDIYNSSLASYRRVNHMRSRAHPVPDLASDGPWLEAPFWLWTADSPRRRRLFVRCTGGGLELTDRERCQLTLPLSADAPANAAVEQLRRQGDRGIRLRPRALITTMYARLLLADLFLHGIGGAKYDQLTDLIIQQFFGCEPPRFATLSATVLLFPDRTPALRNELQRAQQVLRELRYNPERHAPSTAAAQQLVAEKRRWIACAPPLSQRGERHRNLQRVNLNLQPLLAQQVTAWSQRTAVLTEELRQQAKLASREFAFCLFPEAQIRPLLRELSQQGS